MFVEDIVMWTAFTFRKTISNYLDKLSEKTLTLFVFFLKINHIYNDHVGEDMSSEEFRKFCRKCWDRSHGFAVINLTSKKAAEKYREGLIIFKYL